MGAASRGRAWRLAASMVWLAGTMASCAGLFGLDGYQGAASSLCDLLEQCFGSEAYPGCRDYLADALQQAEPQARSSWLETFGSTDCLRNCTAAKACLDMSPICGGAQLSCGQSEHCCGFTIGEGKCLEGRCCQPDGLPCSADADCCNDCSAETGTCGGKRPCLGQDAGCKSNDECCSLHCDTTGRCAPACRQPGEQCTETGDCCSGACSGGLCECLGEGNACDYPEQCCTGICAPDPGNSSQSVCSQDEGCGKANDPCGGPTACCGGLECGPLQTCCAPAGAGCSLPDTCCGGGCGPTGCCSVLGRGCDLDGDCCAGACNGGICGCLPQGQGCAHDADCCSLSCQGTCTGSTCSPPDCHDVCATGGPLTGGNDTSNCVDVNGPCVTEVCAIDPFCCCQQWDATCLSEVTALGSLPGSSCPGACVAPPN